MENAHCEGDAQRWHFLDLKKLCSENANLNNVRYLRLFLEQPSPNWRNFYVQHITCFEKRKSSASVTSGVPSQNMGSHNHPSLAFHLHNMTQLVSQFSECVSVFQEDHALKHVLPPPNLRSGATPSTLVVDSIDELRRREGRRRQQKNQPPLSFMYRSVFGTAGMNDSPPDAHRSTPLEAQQRRWTVRGGEMVEVPLDSDSASSSSRADTDALHLAAACSPRMSTEGRVLRPRDGLHHRRRGDKQHSTRMQLQRGDEPTMAAADGRAVEADRPHSPTLEFPAMDGETDSFASPREGEVEDQSADLFCVGEEEEEEEEEEGEEEEEEVEEDDEEMESDEDDEEEVRQLAARLSISGGTAD